MKTECKILIYNFDETSTNQIQEDIEHYCNNTFFTTKSVKTISCVSKDDPQENYIVNVIYENQIRWIRVLIVFALITYIFLGVMFTFSSK